MLVVDAAPRLVLESRLSEKFEYHMGSWDGSQGRRSGLICKKEKEGSEMSDRKVWENLDGLEEVGRSNGHRLDGCGSLLWSKRGLQWGRGDHNIKFCKLTVYKRKCHNSFNYANYRLFTSGRRSSFEPFLRSIPDLCYVFRYLCRFSTPP